MKGQSFVSEKHLVFNRKFLKDPWLFSSPFFRTLPCIGSPWGPHGVPYGPEAIKDMVANLQLEMKRKASHEQLEDLEHQQCKARKLASQKDEFSNKKQGIYSMYNDVGIMIYIYYVYI